MDIGSPIEASDLNPGKLTYTLEGVTTPPWSRCSTLTGKPAS